MQGKPRQSYPTFPASCWWPLRERFKRALPPSVDAAYLQAVLEIEPKTARNLVPMLRQMGMLSDDGAPTPRANDWRVDVEYPEVCRAIREEIYPAALRHAVPDPVAHFDEAVRWFMKAAGVGTAAAKRMARFYALLARAQVADGASSVDRASSRPASPLRTAVTRNGSTAARNGQTAPPSSRPILPPSERPDAAGPESADPTVQSIDIAPAAGASSPIQLVVQIQLPPGATPEQIDQLVASIARHLGPLAARRG